ncbi:hypothetical protein SSJG_00414 [Escherichia coli D9]|nr:hypothetical protein SSJG_00414 [Escherichia coli D9]
MRIIYRRGKTSSRLPDWCGLGERFYMIFYKKK